MSNDTHGTQDYEHVWPPYNDGADPHVRQFDLGVYGIPTGPERMHVWVTALELRIERLEKAMERHFKADEEVQADL